MVRQEGDMYGQQLDLRPVNTWNTKCGDVPVEELLTTHAVNAMAPFILCSLLKPLMSGEVSTYIINVSAREGKFNKSFNR